MNQNYAGAGVRFVAYLIDIMIIFVIFVVLSMVLTLLGINTNTSGFWVSAIQLVVTFLYVVIYQSSTGQTLGKKVMKIKVVNEAGAKPSAMVFFLREIIGKTISSLIFLIGYLMILWDKRKQGLHDKIAGTFVVKV